MVSIEERVRSKLSQGFWLIVLHRSEIVGCRGCNGLIDKENKVVEFSTVAINSAFRGSGLGMFLVRKAVEIAFERYSPQKMKFDSWSTNKVIDDGRKLGKSRVAFDGKTLHIGKKKYQTKHLRISSQKDVSIYNKDKSHKYRGFIYIRVDENNALLVINILDI